MKCDSCGSIYDLKDKYCKECGEPLSFAETEVETEDFEKETILSPRVLDIWKLYESGDVIEAAKISEELLLLSDASSSLYSIAALVYEKKAAKEEAANQFSLSKASYKRAVELYEAILKENPGSAADTAKLNMLKAKMGMSGLVDGKKTQTFFSSNQARTYISVAAFLIIIIVSFAAFRPKETNKQNKSVTQNTQNFSFERNQSNQRPTKIMTFPVHPKNSRLEQNQVLPQLSGGSLNIPSPSSNRAQGIKPYAVPKLDIKIKPNSAQPKEQTISQPQANEQPKPNEAKALLNDADMMLTNAYDFKSHEDNDKAIASAEKAISLYKEAMQYGANPDRCNSGIDNANRIIELIKN